MADARDPHTRTTFLIKRIELLLRPAVEELVAAAGLTGPQYMTLGLLAHTPGISSAQLARRNSVSAQAAGEVVSTLIRKGLIERLEDPSNRRVLLIHVTEQGRAALQESEQAMGALDARLTAGLDDDARRVMQASLRTYLSTLEEQSGDAVRGDVSAVPAP